MGKNTDIVTVEQIEILLTKLVDKDAALGFNQLHPAAHMHLFDALRQGIRWGKELEKLRKEKDNV